MFKFLKPRRRMKFETLSQLWLEHGAAARKESTQANYRVLLYKHLLPVFGDLQVRDITAELLSDYFASLGESGLSPSTRRSIQLVLQMILHYGQELGLCEPVVFPAMPSLPRSTVSTFTEEEFRRLESWLTDHLSPATLGVLLCMYTGMRLGEICALRWGDVDLNLGTVTVSRTIQRLWDPDTGSHLTVHAPKSHSSNRCIPIPRQLIRLLEPLSGDPEDYLLTGGPQPMEPRCLQRKFKGYLHAAQLRTVNFHTLRHTFATRCMGLDLDPKSLSYLLGHANVTTTMTVYVHPSLEQIRRCVDRLSEVRSA